MQPAEGLEELKPLLDRSAAGRAGRGVAIRTVRGSLAFFYLLGGYRCWPLAPCFWKRDGEERGLRDEEDERKDGGCRVDVELQAERRAKRDGAGGKVRADGRADAETDGESDADMCKGFGAVFGRRHIRQDGAVQGEDYDGGHGAMHET